MVESHINSDRRDGWKLQKTVVKTTNGGRRIVSEKLTVKSCRSVGKKGLSEVAETVAEKGCQEIRNRKIRNNEI